MTTPVEVSFRLQALEQFTDAAELQTIARPINLTNSAKSKGEKLGGLDDVTKVGLNSPEGETLLDALTVSAPNVAEAALSSTPSDLVAVLKPLLPAINAFFDRTMVMSEDPTERFHRLSLANAAAEQLLVAGDFTKLEG
jgi:glycyl-tRNA synthetase beta subunit